MNLNTVLLFLGDLGGGEMMIIMIVVLLLFGADKIPGIARSVGSGIREFKDAASGIKQELEKSMNEEPVKPKTETPYITPPAVETQYTPTRETKMDQMGH